MMKNKQQTKPMYAIYLAGTSEDEIFTSTDAKGEQLTKYEQAINRLFDFMDIKHKLYIQKI